MESPSLQNSEISDQKYKNNKRNKNKTKQNQNTLVYRCVVRAHRGPLQLSRWSKQNICITYMLRGSLWSEDARLGR